MEKETTDDHKNESSAIAWQCSGKNNSANVSFAPPDIGQVVQRWAVPALDEDYSAQNANRLKYLANLPPSGFQNNAMVNSGIYTVPSSNQATLGNFLQGGDAANTLLTMDAYRARGAYYQRGHIIARIFGGPGNARNIVPVQETLNADMYSNIEEPIWTARGGTPKRYFNLQADVTYGGHGANQNLTEPERALPATFTYSLTEQLYQGQGNTRDPANWQDSGNGNLIPGEHQVKVQDLSDLGPASQDGEVQQGVTVTAFDAQRTRITNALAAAQIPQGGAQQKYLDALPGKFGSAARSEDFRTAYTNQAAATFKQLFRGGVDGIVAKIQAEGQYRVAIQATVNAATAIVQQLDNAANLEEDECRQLETSVNDLFNRSLNLDIISENEGDRWITACELVAEITYYFDHRFEEIPDDAQDGIQVSEAQAQGKMRELNAMLIERSDLSFTAFYEEEID